MKKFKVASDESEGEHFPEDPDNELLDEDFLYNDLDEMNLSDSGTDGNLDEISIGSTPKPVLRYASKLWTERVQSLAETLLKRQPFKCGHSF